MHRLEGKVAIVTGSASGIGAETIQLMAREGAKVVVADFNLPGAQDIAERIIAAGGEATSVFVDSTQEESVKEMIGHAVSTYGKLDILHNNAGGSKPIDVDVSNMTKEAWDFAMNLNLTSVMWGCKHGVLAMRENGGGSIINTASVSGLLGDHSYTAYGVAKAGVVNLTRYVATQEGKRNIRCNAIAPGLIITPASEAVYTEEIKAQFEKNNALSRLGSPKDIAQAAVFLGSDESLYMTGHILQLDGGSTVHQPNLS
ncbi:SDR family NAD(P)-dependent oxidoreductase [Bacillus testis]|uniref:SDR family NAD(P)-dependent oxidoreductase n=1 Tax=Bacillus testis TaxID=1622072 RepID=UPI00067EEA82|nr:SDR family oxidoreductase [Bacillus testis]